MAPRILGKKENKRKKGGEIIMAIRGEIMQALEQKRVALVRLANSRAQYAAMYGVESAEVRNRDRWTDEVQAEIKAFEAALAT